MNEFPGFKTLIRETIETYKLHYKTYFILIALSIGVPLTLLLTGGGLGLLSSIATATNTTLFGALFIPIVIILGAVLIYLQTWLQIAIIKTTSGEGDKSIKLLLSKNRNKIVPMLVLSILSGLIVLGGFVFFILPGILLSVWFVFAIYILVFEDVRGMNALIKSREYVRGYFTTIFVNLFLLQIVLFLTQFIPTLIFKEILNQDTLASIISFVLQLLVIPVSVIFTYQMYKFVRASKSDIPNDYSRAKKNKYLVLGIIGPVIAAALAGIVIWAFAQLPWGDQFPQNINNDVETIDDTVSMLYTSITSNL